MWGNVGFLHSNVRFRYSKCPIMWKDFRLQCNCKCEVMRGLSLAFRVLSEVNTVEYEDRNSLQFKRK